MFNDIVQFIAHKYPTQSDLQTLVIRAFHDHPNILAKIDLSGSPDQAAIRLVRTLQRYEEISSGTKALWHLLLTAKDDFGFNIQSEIDAFEGYANTAQNAPTLNKRSSIESISVQTQPETNPIDTQSISTTQWPVKTLQRFVLLLPILGGLVVFMCFGLFFYLQSVAERSNNSATQIARANLSRTPTSIISSTSQSTEIPNATEQHINNLTAVALLMTNTRIPTKTSVPLSTPIQTFTLSVTQTSTPTSTPTSQNGLIAFERNGDIYTMKVDGSGVKRLTTEGVNSNPAWSSDGSTIVFIRDKNIYTMKADGSEVTQVTTEGNIGAPAWSPDGKRIAFISDRMGSYDIYVMSIDGGQIIRLTTQWMNYSPVWSPDGEQIAFSSYGEGSPNIYVVNLDGGKITRLTKNRMDANPAWSPDGKRIAFSSYGMGLYNIYVMDADGSDILRLTTEGNNYHPAWSPNGQRIIFESHREGQSNIYVMGADGSRPLRSTSEGGEAPAWQPIPWNANP
jgi:hypothetical protein